MFWSRTPRPISPPPRLLLLRLTPILDPDLTLDLSLPSSLIAVSLNFPLPASLDNVVDSPALSAFPSDCPSVPRLLGTCRVYIRRARLTCASLR